MTDVPARSADAQAALDAQWWHGPDAGGRSLFDVRRAGDPATMEFAAGEWALSLPHQCDSWVAASSRDRAEALAQAYGFRAELEAAIAKLEAT